MRRQVSIMQRYVNIAWGSFWRTPWQRLFGLLVARAVRTNTACGFLSAAMDGAGNNGTGNVPCAPGSQKLQVRWEGSKARTRGFCPAIIWTCFAGIEHLPSKNMLNGFLGHYRYRFITFGDLFLPQERYVHFKKIPTIVSYD